MRRSHNRLLTGTAAGLAERFDIDPVMVRAAFVVLVAAGGFGFLLYAALWVVSSEPPAEAVSVGTRNSPRILLGICFIVGGVLVALRTAGVWPGDDLVFPVAIAALGLSVMRLRPREDTRWGRLAARLPDNPLEALFTTKPSPARIAIGSLLIVGGAIAFAAVQLDFHVVRRALVPIFLTILGVALATGPWLLKLGQQLTRERRQRIRSEERAEMAAHLHDSVLQTLALIQRTTDPRTVVSLARVQERELRAWLYGHLDTPPGGYLSAAVDEMAGRIEQMHQVSVEAVVVGDAVMSPRLQAFVHACAEAASNAARHSGADLVSVYVELEGDRLTAYVRDQGRGFDPDAVDDDRRGIAESIRGRMERYGGEAVIQSELGVGTEVQLSMPAVSR